MAVIGEIVFDIRGIEKVGQNLLCEGICSASTLSRMEWEGRNVSYWLVEALLQRLGKSQDSFWSIINISDYNTMEIRRKIRDGILCGNYAEAQEDALSYDKRVTTNTNNGNLHRQFIWRCLGMMKGRGEHDWKSAVEFFTKSIQYTVAEFSIENVAALLYGRDEILGILLLAEAYGKIGDNESSGKLLSGLVENMEQKIWDSEEKVKIYPKVIRRYIDVLKREDRYEDVIAYAQDAVNLLVNNGVIFLLSELMESIMWGIKRGSVVEERRFSIQEEQEYRQLEIYVKVLKEVWGEYGDVAEEDMIYCTNMQKDISISNEVLAKCRKLCKLSQEELSQDICTVENLSRIENFKCSPMDRSYRGLMEKMNQVKERNRYLVNSREYTLHEKVRKVEQLISSMEYRKAAKEWKLVKKDIPADTCSNQQCIARYDTILWYYNKEIDAKCAMKEYVSALKKTMPDYPDVDIINWPLSRNEIFLLTSIAELHKTEGQLETTIEIYKKLYEFFESSTVNVLYRSVEYRLILYNMSTALVDAQQYEAVHPIIEKGIKCGMSSGRFNMLPYFLYIKAVVFIEEKLEEKLEENTQKARILLKQAFCISNILKMPSLSSYISDYYKESFNKELEY